MVCQTRTWHKKQSYFSESEFLWTICAAFNMLQYCGNVDEVNVTHFFFQSVLFGSSEFQQNSKTVTIGPH